MRYLVTGCAGFIGYHVCEALLARGDEVAGLDDLNDYYDVALKEARLARLDGRPGFSFLRCCLQDRAAVDAVFAAGPFERVIHLAAQAGVRYSLTNPAAYVASNIAGFQNVLEACRHAGTAHLVYASSSSVYGANTKTPFAETDPADHPVSLYAATKRANELAAHAYSHLFDLPTTGLRFFTVYGPWGRPDMALYLFADAILKGRPIKVFNYGRMRRDFTYIDDIVDGVLRAADRAPAKVDPAAAPATPAAEAGTPASAAAPYRIYNLGGDRPVELSRLIELLEAALGRKAEQQLLPIQPGDVSETAADLTLARRDLGFDPKTPVEEGVRRFAEWFRGYSRV